MKRFRSKQTLGSMLLISALVAPGIVFADAPYDNIVTPAVQQLNNDMNAQQMDSTVGQSYVSQIWNYMNKDFSNKDLARALINYQAALQVNEYLYNQQLLWMAAPGSVYAVQAGSAAGQFNVPTLALPISNSSFLSSIGSYSGASNFTGPLAPSGNAQNSKPLSQGDLYTQLQPFFASGDTSGLVVVNPGLFLETDNLAKFNNNQGISSAQSQQMINIVTNPFPTAPVLSGSLSNPSGADQDTLVNGLVGNAILTVSSSALSDIVARRTPQSSSTPSVIEMMNKYSQQRFTNPDWYSQIATASEPALLRELAHMQAYNTWVQFQQFRLLEQQTALMATMNTVMARLNIGLNQLNAQMAQATAQAKASTATLQQQMNQNNSCPSGQISNGTGGCLCGSGSKAGQDASGGC